MWKIKRTTKIIEHKKIIWNTMMFFFSFKLKFWFYFSAFHLCVEPNFFGETRTLAWFVGNSYWIGISTFFRVNLHGNSCDLNIKENKEREKIKPSEMFRHPTQNDRKISIWFIWVHFKIVSTFITNLFLCMATDS